MSHAPDEIRMKSTPQGKHFATVSNVSTSQISSLQQVNQATLFDTWQGFWELKTHDNITRWTKSKFSHYDGEYCTNEWSTSKWKHVKCFPGKILHIIWGWQLLESASPYIILGC